MQDEMFDTVQSFERRRFGRRGSLMVVMLIMMLAVMLPTPAFANGTPLMQPLLLQSVAAVEADSEGDAAEATGVVIIAVDADGPAAHAGIARGDILLTVDDVEIDSAAALYGVVLEAVPGDEVTVGVQHGDELLAFAVTLGQIDDRAYLGMQVVDAPGADGLVALPTGAVEVDTDSEIESDGEEVIEIVTGTVQATDVDEHEVISLGAGLLVAEVMEDSPAAQAGLVAGDLLLAVNGEPVMLPEALGDALAAYAPGDEVHVQVQKGGLVGAVIVEVPITLGAAPDDATRAYLGIRMVAMPDNMTLPVVPSVRAYAAPAMPMSPEDGVGYVHPGLRWMPYLDGACGQGDVIIQQYFFGGPGEVQPLDPSVVPPAAPSMPQSFTPPMMQGEPIFIYREGVHVEDVSVATATAMRGEEHVVILRDSAPMRWTMAVPGDSPQWVEITEDAKMGIIEVEIVEAEATEIEADEVEINAAIDGWH